MTIDPAAVAPQHFLWDFADGVATITLNRPERKNPLTFASYAELRDTFNALGAMRQVKAVVLTGAGGNFCSGGDVHEIIGPLTKMDRRGLIEFTTMTGDLVYLRERDEIGAHWREIMGANYPAMALVEVKGLVEPAAKIEIETTAVVEE